MKKYLCIHGHFYQPPRENPWLEQIERQDSAAPFHDWNERIAAECYGPNTASRIVDSQGRILEIVDNYSKISFNFGPTLLSWMEKARPDIYQGILDADRISANTRNGHGNALAQAYNHAIMPLADFRDKVTQVKWGIADFEHRFSRRPEGMWLPETAVDTETLSVLAQEGIRFTLLSPAQARRIRNAAVVEGRGGKTQGETGKKDWQDVSGGKIDPTRPYRVALPFQRFIDVFFYDGPISHGIAFERLLGSGEGFMDRLNKGFSRERTWPQLLNIATDGESYGHHFSHGDMALGYVLRRIEREKEISLTNYATFLSEFPPDQEVELIERSSWSCAHGVERWRSDCGCRIGGQADWNQSWRGPLREGLDELKKSLDLFFERGGEGFFKDPWAARNDYITVILQREKDVGERFLSGHQKRELSPQERILAIRLLEVQRQALLMFTSCGWFFDDLSGIEAVQVLRYAARAIELTQGIKADTQGAPQRLPDDPVDLERALLTTLSKAKSNLSEFGNGAEIYESLVRPSEVGFGRLVAHYAVDSLLSPTSKPGKFYCFDLRIEDQQRAEIGGTSLAVGRLEATSRVTFEEKKAAFGVILRDGATLHCVVRENLGPEVYAEAKIKIFELFSKASPSEAARELEDLLRGERFGLSSLLLEERRRFLQEISQRFYTPPAGVKRNLYRNEQAFMEELIKVKVRPPEEFLLAVRNVLNQELASLSLDVEGDQTQKRSVQIAQEAKKWGVALQTEWLKLQLETQLKEKLLRKIENIEIDAPINDVFHLLDLSEALGISLNLWEAQNLFNRLRQNLVTPSVLVEHLGQRLLFR